MKKDEKDADAEKKTARESNSLSSQRNDPLTGPASSTTNDYCTTAASGEQAAASGPVAALMKPMSLE